MRLGSSNNFLWCLVVSIISFASLAASAQAQDTNAASGTNLDTIVVEGETSTDENKQGKDLTVTEEFLKQRDIPASVTILDKQQIEQQGITDLRTLSGTSSNFTSFDDGGNRMTQLSVRGVREQSYQSAPEILPSVGYYVDDVPSLTILGRASLFNNVGSITLKKGPQNSGYGFSRAGGVVDIRTPEPSEKFSGYVNGSYGNYKAYDVSFGIVAPIVNDKLYVALDVVKAAREGFYDNLDLGGSYGDKDALGGRLRITLRPLANVTVDLTVQHERFRDQADPYIDNPLTNTDPFKVSFDQPGFEDIDQDLQSLRIRSKFKEFNFMSVTAHRRTKWDYSSDAIQYGAVYADLIGAGGEEIDSFTQEFRFSSNNTPSEISWSGGMFYSRTTMDYIGAFTLNDGSPYGPPTEAETTSHDIAGFGEVTIPLTAAIKVQAGLRYDWAGRKGTNEFSGPNLTAGDEDFSQFSPSLALIYSDNPNMSYYAKYARGFKPGGFNARTRLIDPYAFEYEIETSDNFEIGAKALFLDGKLAINSSLFYSKFDDYQDLSQFSPYAFGINNAQSARSYGAELEAKYQITSQVKLFANLGYTNAKYDTFTNGFFDFSGKIISFTPEYTATYGVEYNDASGLYASARARTIGSYYIDDVNSAKQDIYTLVDLVAGYRWDNFDASLFVNNLSDEQYVINSLNFTGSAIGSVGDPRTFGVKLRTVF